MADPKIADKKPVVTSLDPGKYWWCRCGHSKNQPFCDGSHAGTGFQPMEFEITTKKNYALCACKHTASSPFCDGTHSKLK